MKNILYISIVDWFWVKQRPHHIPEILSEKYHVDFLCIKDWSAKNIEEEYELEADGSFKVNDRLHVFRKKILPKRFMQPMKMLNEKLIMRSFINRQIQEKKYDVIFITHPTQVGFVEHLFHTSMPIIYDCMDDYTEMVSNVNWMIKSEKMAVFNATKIVVSSSHLAQKLIEKYDAPREKITLVNNGVDFEFFDLYFQKYKQKPKKIQPRKKIVYIGTVGPWFDLELLIESAKQNKDYDYDIYGPLDSQVEINKDDMIDNVHFHGSIEYKKVPETMLEGDVLILPFKVNEVVKAVNPVKIYEYLAVGKPVLARKYPETEKFGEIIYTYENLVEFNQKLIQIFQDEKDVTLSDQRNQYAAENSWRQRTEVFYSVIQEAIKEKSQPSN